MQDNTAYNQKLGDLFPLLIVSGYVDDEIGYTLDGFINWLNYIFFYSVAECFKTIPLENGDLLKSGQKLINRDKIILKEGMFYPCLYKRKNRFNIIQRNVFEDLDMHICFQPYLYDRHYIIDNGVNSKKEALDYIEEWKYKNHPEEIINQIDINPVFQNSLFLIKTSNNR